MQSRRASDNFIESDWKLFRKHKDAMLEELSARLTEQALGILSKSDLSAYERYLKVYEQINDSDEVVARCFNDWRRSTMGVFASHLARNELIPDELWEGLSGSAKKTIELIAEL